MAVKPLLLEPAIIIVDNDPECAAYISDIVTAVLGVKATIFTDKPPALEWCAGHPVHVDLVITREGDHIFNGFKLLKELDKNFMRPVYAILLLNPRGNDSSAESWFYQLDKVFTTIKPLKALRYPYLMHKLGTALDDAFSWFKPDMQSGKRTQENKNQMDEK
jgi:hypothetical protein